MKLHESDRKVPLLVLAFLSSWWMIGFSKAGPKERLRLKFLFDWIQNELILQLESRLLSSMPLIFRGPFQPACFSFESSCLRCLLWIPLQGGDFWQVYGRRAHFFLSGLKSILFYDCIADCSQRWSEWNPDTPHSTQKDRPWAFSSQLICPWESWRWDRSWSVPSPCTQADLWIHRCQGGCIMRRGRFGGFWVVIWWLGFGRRKLRGIGVWVWASIFRELLLINHCIESNV